MGLSHDKNTHKSRPFSQCCKQITAVGRYKIYQNEAVDQYKLETDAKNLHLPHQVALLQLSYIAKL